VVLLAVCATSHIFATPGAVPAGISGFGYAVLPTNDGSKVLAVDYNNFNDRVVVYSAKDFSYIAEWPAPPGPLGLAQAPGANGNIYVSGYSSDSIFELDSSTGSLAKAHQVEVGWSYLSQQGGGHFPQLHDLPPGADL
jgi:outer membrane protein assembly factor BamB